MADRDQTPQNAREMLGLGDNVNGPEVAARWESFRLGQIDGARRARAACVAAMRRVKVVLRADLSMTDLVPDVWRQIKDMQDGVANLTDEELMR